MKLIDLWKNLQFEERIGLIQKFQQLKAQKAGEKTNGKHK
jgi:hypothetical protein